MPGYGIPKITTYGSSYGKFGGQRLSDYTPNKPDPSNLNNQDMTDVVEWESFTKTVKDFVFAKLGHPIIDIELTDFQIQLCIEEAISKMEYFAPNSMTQYAEFAATSRVNVYELPDWIANGLTQVFFKRTLFSIGATPGSLEYDFAIMFFTNTGIFDNFRVSDYLLMQQYLKQIKKVLGQDCTWKLVDNKYLHIFPDPEENEPVLLEFRALNPNTIHPVIKNWIQRYSLCLAKEILGRIRSKYQVLPGPSGGSKLDGEALLQEVMQEKERLEEELRTQIAEPPIFDIF